MDAGDATQSMPLHEAARAGSVALVQMLLGNGAKAESPDRSGVTPLHHAASGGHVEVLTLLQQHGASVEAYSGENPHRTAHPFASVAWLEWPSLVIATWP